MKYILITLAMLVGGNAYANAGDVIAPPVSKYVAVPTPPKRPDNFGKTDNQKVAQKIQEVTTKK